MLFKNYQSFVSSTFITDSFTNDRNKLSYVFLGLFSEVGEVLSVFKKYLRGDYDYSTFKTRLIDELGDVVWYSVNIFNLLDYSASDNLIFSFNSLPLHSQLYNLSKISSNIFSYYNLIHISSNPLSSLKFNSSHIIYLIHELLSTINSILKHYQLSLIDVIEFNQSKLTSRMSSNSIRGDGIR
ncbi:MAG: hypothetical protein QXW48_01460 [Thermoplasmata archaeon]